MKITLREYEVVFLRDVLKETPDGRWETGGMLKRLREQFKKLAHNTRHERARRNRYARAVRIVRATEQP